MTHDAASESAIADQLAGVPLFASLDAANRRAIAKAATILDLSPGDTITREGTVAEEFFVLLSGEATVSIRVDEAAIRSRLASFGPAKRLESLAFCWKHLALRP